MPMATRASRVLRDGAARLLRMRYIFDGIKKKPHPEEPAQRASRRTHGIDPTGGRSFPTRPTAVGRHHLDKTLEQVMAVLRAGARLGVVLHRKDRQVPELQPFVAAVEQ